MSIQESLYEEIETLSTRSRIFVPHYSCELASRTDKSIFHSYHKGTKGSCAYHRLENV